MTDKHAGDTVVPEPLTSTNDRTESREKTRRLSGTREGRSPKGITTRLKSMFQWGSSEDESRARARRWFEQSIASWEEEGRITGRQARQLQGDLDQPQFLTVLPHFGVHLTIGAVLRFPVGSIVRFTYVLMNILLVSLRLLLRRIDRRTWTATMGVHSPLVALVAGFPGIGTFAYLLAKPLRSNLLLMRVGLDAVLLKLPKKIYERSGLRWILALPARSARESVHNPMRIAIWAQSIVLVQALIIGTLFAADVLSKSINHFGVLDPEMFGWAQFSRMLNLGAETSFGTWYQVMALAALSILLASIAVAKQRAGDRYHRHWLMLALLSLGFSIDEQVKIHDAGGGTAVIRDQLGMSGPFYFGWVIVGAISVALVVFFYRRFFMALPGTTKVLFGLAAILYVGGEIVLESISGWYLDTSGGNPDFAYQLLSSVEEFLGMVGIFLAITGVLQYVQKSFGDLTLSLEGDTSASIRPAVTTTPEISESSCTLAPVETGSSND